MWISVQSLFHKALKLFFLFLFFKQVHIYITGYHAVVVGYDNFLSFTNTAHLMIMEAILQQALCIQSYHILSCSCFIFFTLVLLFFLIKPLIVDFIWSFVLLVENHTLVYKCKNLSINVCCCFCFVFFNAWGMCKIILSFCI